MKPLKKSNKEKEDALIELGKFYFLNEKYNQAIKEFEKALKINPVNQEIYYNLGIIYETLNQIVTAQEMFTRVLKLKENHLEAKKHLEKLIGK